MNYVKITKHDIANGPGVRVALWVQGCSIHCNNCHNQITWNFDYGKQFTNETMHELYDALNLPYIQGLTLTGGHPLEKQNIKQCTEICITIKTMLPEKDIWLYTGYVWEDIKDLQIMNYIDVLVDGPYIDELRDISLAFCGSSNQRIIDVQQSLQQNKIILWKEGI